MKKRKINVCLQAINAITAGMSVYLNELVMRLMNYEDLQLEGVAFRGLRSFFSDKPEAYKRFTFPIRLSSIPAWAIFQYTLLRHRLAGSFLRCFLKKSYNAYAGEGDVFLFGQNKMPVLPVTGKVITVIHDLIPLRVPELCDKEFVDDFKRNFWNTIEKSTKIITDSEYSKKDIVDLSHISEDKIDVVYCAADTEKFSRAYPEAEIERVREKYNLPEKYILYFGTCGKRKNVESVVRAYALLPEATRKEYKLVISNPKDTTRSCVAENGVDSDVTFIELVSNEEKPIIYQMASAFVWVSLYEGFGLPIVEAMAAGVPVVCSNVTSLPEVAGDAAILVDPLDIKAIADGIERCLYDEPFRADLITKGYENIKRFSWDDSAKKLHDIIMSV